MSLLMIGQIVSHYRILKELGKGAMSMVYLAEDERLGRKVAIKIAGEAPNDAQFRDRFLREARIAASLSHKNIATIHDCDITEDGLLYIVMEYLQGQPLSERLKSGDFPLITRLRIIEEIAEALAEAHRMGVIHRDIKPGNIFITERGDVKVLDFGLAKHFRTTKPGEVDLFAQTVAKSDTQEGTILGSPNYMSPEQAKGESAETDARSDLFSLGAVLYECLASRLPFPGNTMAEIVGRIQFVDPSPPSQFNPQVSAELDRIALKALAKSPDGRYQTADEMLAHLRCERGKMSGFESSVPPKTIDGEVASKSAVKIYTSRTILKTINRLGRRWPIFIALLAILYLGTSRALRWPPFELSRHQLSNTAKISLEDGLRFLQDGAYYQAKLSLQKAVEADLQYLPSRLRLAEALNELDYKDEARKQLTEIYRLSRDFGDYTEIDQLLLKAVHATIDNRFDEAIKYYSDIVRIASNSEKAQAYFDLGRAYEKYQQTNEAINQYKQVIGLDPQSAAAHLHLGICYGVRLKELGNAEFLFGQAEKLYQASGGLGLEGFTEVLFQRGTMYDGVNNLDKAREQLERARHQSMQLSNKYQYIKAVLQLSINSLYKGNYSLAQSEAEEAIKLASAERMDNLIPQGLIHLGSVFRRRRQYSEAESYFRQAEESARSYNGLYNIALAQSNLSSLYAEQGTRLEEALREAEKARAFFKTAGYRGEELTVLLIIARANRKLGHFDAAQRAFEEVLPIVSKQGDQYTEGLTHSEMGQLLANQEKYPEALTHMNKRYQISKSLNQNDRVIYALLYRADVLSQLGSYREAGADLKEAKVILTSPEVSNKGLATDILLLEAKIALSLLKPQDAKVKSKQVIAQSSPDSIDVLIKAKNINCAAHVISGTPHAGIAQCKEAVSLAEKTGNKNSLSASRLAMAQAELALGNAEKALEIVMQSLEEFTKLSQFESEWRARLIAALANQRLERKTTMHAQALQAAEVLTTLQKKWGEDAFAHYMLRPDIKQQHQELNNLLSK